MPACECGCGGEARKRFLPFHHLRAGVRTPPPTKTWEDYPAPVRDQASGCLRWQGPHHSQGYGLIGARQYAHRTAWEREVGLIPEGHQIDHVRDRGCVYRDCVAIEHLEPVTQAENIRRIPRIQAQIARTECPQGHKYADGNLRVRRGKRECRRCHNDRTAARKRERRSK
jgi:hypothetical protein